MPLEVREIAIRMEVGGGRDPCAAARRDSADAEGDDDVMALLTRGADDDRRQAQLVERCVAAVLIELARREGP